MTIAFGARVSVRPDVLVSEVGGELVMLNLASEGYFGLDAVGARLWAALTTSDSIQKAHDTLLEEYDVTAEQLRRDLEELIGRLVEQGLVEVTGG
jgi:hypothetical protein